MKHEFNKETWYVGQNVWFLNRMGVHIGKLDINKEHISFPLIFKSNNGFYDNTFTYNGHVSINIDHCCLFPYEIEIIKKPEFEQSEKVKVSDDGKKFFERVFVCKFKDKYLCLDISEYRDAYLWNIAEKITAPLYTDEQVDHAKKVLKEMGIDKI